MGLTGHIRFFRHFTTGKRHFPATSQSATAPFASVQKPGKRRIPEGRSSNIVQYNLNIAQ